MPPIDCSISWWIWRECLISSRQMGYVALPGIFLTLLLVIFPLTVTLTNHTLQQLFPGLIWVGWLLSAMLTSDRVCTEDIKHGHWLQWQLHQCPLLRIVCVKLLVHWCVITLPLLLLLPVASALYQVPPSVCGWLCVSLLTGTPVVAQLLMLLSVLLLATQQRQLLIPLLLLPLALPIMVLGSGVVTSAVMGISVVVPLSLLLGVTLMATATLPAIIVGVLTTELRY